MESVLGLSNHVSGAGSKTMGMYTALVVLEPHEKRMVVE
jgi:hypothetical protein